MAPDNAKPEAEGAPARQPDRAAAVALAPRRARVRRACQINPVSLLFGPIFDKEMRVQGRRVSTYWVRALYASGLLGLVAFVYFGLMSQI
jgi:hypothetical protein